MRSLLLAGALTLVGGLGLAAPAFAGYYDEYGNFHATDSDYNYDKSYNAPDYYPSYNTPTYRNYGELSSWQIRESLRSQGYYNISDLRHEAYGDRWIATAYINGDLVRVTVDGDDGHVLYVNQI